MNYTEVVIVLVIVSFFIGGAIGFSSGKDDLIVKLKYAQQTECVRILTETEK